MSFLKKLFRSKKDDAITGYSDFWNWFQQHGKYFLKVVKKGNDVDSKFLNKLSPKLAQVNADIYFVTGMYDDQTAELIFTAEGEIKNIALVEEFVKAAPAIDGWRFTALKPSTDISNIVIVMSEETFSSKNISFYSNELVDYPDEIDITLVHNDYNESNKDIITNGSYIYLDNLLGELNSISIIDNLKVIGPSEATKPLIPIEKLNDFLIWREKEFVEKYDGLLYNTEDDTHSGFEAKGETGNPLLAVINTDILKWDAKASHPWMVNVEITYDGSQNNGLPDNETYQQLDVIEEDILEYLKDFDGYLYIGRQTSDSIREIYFACKEFRKPSKVIPEIIKKYASQFEISYDIFKDKYWMSLNRFKND